MRDVSLFINSSVDYIPCTFSWLLVNDFSLLFYWWSHCFTFINLQEEVFSWDPQNPAAAVMQVKKKYIYNYHFNLFNRNSVFIRNNKDPSSMSTASKDYEWWLILWYTKLFSPSLTRALHTLCIPWLCKAKNFKAFSTLTVWSEYLLRSGLSNSPTVFMLLYIILFLFTSNTSFFHKVLGTHATYRLHAALAGCQESSTALQFCNYDVGQGATCWCCKIGDIGWWEQPAHLTASQMDPVSVYSIWPLNLSSFVHILVLQMYILLCFINSAVNLQLFAANT